MFFSGDPTSKRKVDLGGRSSKERDRGKLLEVARLERKKRERFRLETQSAITIQKVFRGRRTVAVERQTVRNQFCTIYGELGEKIDKSAFKVESKCLPELIFFYQSHEKDDFRRLTAVCRSLHLSLIEAGDLDTLFSIDNLSSEKSIYESILEHRVKNLAYLCIVAIHHYRAYLRRELLLPIVEWDREFHPAVLLLHTILTLTDSGVSCSGVVLDFLYKKKLFVLLRELLQTVSEENHLHNTVSFLEHAVILLAHRHAGKGPNVEKLDLWSFSVQILSIPLVFHKFPSLKQAFVDKGLWESSVWQLSSSLPEFIEQLPSSSSPQFPSSVCLLGNLLEVSGLALSLRDCPLDLAVNFATVSRCLMEVFSSQYIKPSDPVPDEDSEESMEVDVRELAVPIDKALEDQLLYASKPDIIKNLVRIVFPGISVASKGKGLVPLSTEAAAMAEVCGFFFASFSLFPNSGAIMTLAYGTELVSYLWHYMERCNSAHEWPIISLQHKSDEENYPGMELDGLLLPLSVFCPVYSYMLLSLDNEEFYEQQKPLQLDDLRILVIILKEGISAYLHIEYSLQKENGATERCLSLCKALWQLLWVLPSKLAPSSSAFLKKVSKPPTGQKVFSSSFFRQKVGRFSSTLLAQLQDWNNRRQFIPPQDFYAREAMDEIFFAQVEHENSRACELLYQAPFLIPFTHRVRIYTAQLNSAKQHDSRSAFASRLRIQIRRDRIVEDAFASLSSLSEEALHGTIRVSFVNEFGVEEAGVDGGGIFKDFMENITKAAFDIQYGLFKETPDHLLYPNPASHMVHDEHLQYFEFMGKILGKAMFEGILVDIPFATFFLSKLKKKHNYLHDLQSLDPELYRSLLFLKKYEGDLTQLGLYFVIENNEYGEQAQVELLPGGKDIQVNNDNVIRYIHLVANYRLNIQIRQQSYFFLRGFQQLIQSKWIDMFNEHELQLLISGSVDGLNVDDLRSNANYAGGYSEDHPVIEEFWDIVKTFDSRQQQMFLKFVTGCSRGPLLGFKYLDPQFCIQRAGSENVSDEMLDRLPTSATCINLLKLPPYTRKEVLKAKLLYAINADAGFDLS